jgi:hypothetical protein
MSKKYLCEGVEIFGGYYLNSNAQADKQSEALKQAEFNRKTKNYQVELSQEEIEIIEELSKNDEYEANTTIDC